MRSAGERRRELNHHDTTDAMQDSRCARRVVVIQLLFCS